MPIRVCLGIVACFLVWFWVVPVYARLQDADQRLRALPDGEGKQLVATLCASCHSLEVTLKRKRTKAEWKDNIQDMIGRGTPATAEEAATIADFLGTHYSPDQGSVSAGPAPQRPSKPTSSLPEGPGKALVADKCAQCHNQGMWSDLRGDRRVWQGVIYRMVGKGALWIEDEINSMADYLARAFGPGGASSPW